MVPDYRTVRVRMVMAASGSDVDVFASEVGIDLLMSTIPVHTMSYSSCSQGREIHGCDEHDIAYS